MQKLHKCHYAKRLKWDSTGAGSNLYLNNGIHCELYNGKVLAPHYRWTGSPAPKQFKHHLEGETGGGLMYLFPPMQWIRVACSYLE